MKTPPINPLALRDRVMSALLDDIADTNARIFKRVDALREIARQEITEMMAERMDDCSVDLLR